MRWRIKANTFFTHRYLEVHDLGVTFVETAIAGGRRKFRFEQIDCVYMSPQNQLSLQIGTEMLSVPVNPKKRKHQEAVSALLTALRQTVSQSR